MYISQFFKKFNLHELVLLIIILVICQLSYAQTDNHRNYALDHLFPKKKNNLITLGTGIPYTGIAEYSYGFTDRFSIGILYGLTPMVSGYGIRIKNVLHQQSDDFRLYLKTPILYYPKTQDLGGEPWFLTWPSFNAEWKFRSGLRFAVGGGIVAAACANDLLGLEHDHEEAEHHDEHAHVHNITPLETDTDPDGFMGDIWNTVQASIAVPIGRRFMIQTELAIVLDGISIADEAWVGRYPVILFMGVSYEF